MNAVWIPVSLVLLTLSAAPASCCGRAAPRRLLRQLR